MSNALHDLQRTANRNEIRRAVVLMLVLMLASVGAGGGELLSQQEQRGKRIYVEGESEAGTPITAVISRGATPIPASILPCGGCHGEDGKGRPEGGVVPPDITWKSLTAVYGHEHSYGRRHEAFDESSLASAIAEGMDPARNALDVAMPRYRMSREDMTDLIAYLKRIESDLDAGLTEDTIRVGSLLPIDGPLASIGTAMKNVLEASFADINATGGVHGRRIELLISEHDEDPQQTLWNARDLLQSNTVFAMVGGYTAGVESAIARTAEELEVPMIGAFTQLPQIGSGLGRHSFYLTSGLVQQAAVLARSNPGAVEGRPSSTAIIHSTGSIYDEAIAAVKSEILHHAEPPPLTVAYQPPYLDVIDVVETLKAAGISTVVFLGQAAQFRRLANAAGEEGYGPDLLLPGLFAGKSMFEIDPGFAGRIFIGYSSIPSDHTEDGIREFETLHRAHGFGYEHSTAQIAAFVAVKVFIEGLKRAGRALSREKLVASIEGLTEFQPGLMPPISYNRRKRIGAYGGYVMELDLQNENLRPVSGWIPLPL